MVYVIEPSHSQWNFPCVLVPNQMAPAVSVLKINSVTKTDSYLIPRIDKCINKIGHSRYVSIAKGILTSTFDRESQRRVRICDPKWSVPVMRHALHHEECPHYFSADDQ